MSAFNNNDVEKVSLFIQNHMKKNRLKVLSADDCATLLAENKILPYNKHPKPGFNFRQMLRDGRDGHIDRVKGACQSRPKTRWWIHSVD
jgi:hypothetical protein